MTIYHHTTTTTPFITSPFSVFLSLSVSLALRFLSPVCLSSISLSIHTYLSFPVFISLSLALCLSLSHYFLLYLAPSRVHSIIPPSLNTVSLFLRLSHSSSYTVCFYFYLSLLSSRSQYFSRIRLLFPIPSHLSILFHSFFVFFHLSHLYFSSFYSFISPPLPHFLSLSIYFPWSPSVCR